MTDWRAIYEAGELKRKDNLCTGCWQNFGSVTAFDAHRIGKHEYTFWEGAGMSPPRYDGRRCRDIEEMREFGFQQTGEGRWSLSPWVGKKYQSGARAAKRSTRRAQRAAGKRNRA